MALVPIIWPYIAAVLTEHRTPEARAILRAGLGNIAVPALWYLEVGNILVRAERRGMISPNDRLGHIADLSLLPVTVDHKGAARAWRTTTALALRHGLTLYDGTYLELALRHRIPLATFDAALTRAAAAENLPPR